METEQSRGRPQNKKQFWLETGKNGRHTEMGRRRRGVEGKG